MKGYELKFNIYANNEAEVEEAREAIVGFIRTLGESGIAVSAKRVAEVVPQWQNNSFVKQQIINIFS